MYTFIKYWNVFLAMLVLSASNLQFAGISFSSQRGGNQRRERQQPQRYNVPPRPVEFLVAPQQSQAVAPQDDIESKLRNLESRRSRLMVEANQYLAVNTDEALNAAARHGVAIEAIDERIAQLRQQQQA